MIEKLEEPVETNHRTSYLITALKEGKNSVLFKIPAGFILYEKLSNTIHFGREKELKNLHKKGEKVGYTPIFESGSLKKMKSKKIDSLLLNVTEKCNFNCGYCIFSGDYKNERKENKLNMNFQTAKKAIDMYMPLTNKKVFIGFYGGEPLNNINLIKKIISYTNKNYSKKNTLFLTASNFYNANKHQQYLIDNKIGVTISLDGPKSIHDKNRKLKDGRPTFDKIISNMQKIQQIAPEYAKTYLSQNATYQDPNDLKEIFEFFDKNDRFKISRINGVDLKGLKKKPPILKKDFNLLPEYLSRIRSRKDTGILRTFFDQKLNAVASRSKEEMPEKLMLNGACHPGKRRLFVETDGQFYMCEKIGRRLPIGDVEKGIAYDSIDDAINKFTEIRNELCTKGCWAQRLCAPCISSSKDPEGDISKQGLAQICESEKNQILTAIITCSVLDKEDRSKFKSYVKSIHLK